MRLSLIVAAGRNGVIGVNGELPWRLSNDLKRFRSLTTGHHIIMGRKTFESINRLLPDRTTVIVTRQLDYSVAGAIVVHSLEEAINTASQDDEVFIIGGAEIYRLAMPIADRIYFTHVDAMIDGDATFPEMDLQQWNIVEEQKFDSDEKNEYSSIYRVYDRRK
jgi:dihydrofolate reductase